MNNDNVILELIKNTNCDNSSLLRVLLQELYKEPFVNLKDIHSEKLKNSGVYCIYYTGKTHYLYNGIGRDNPIYIGKSTSTFLYNRLKQHSKSIDEVNDLNVSDFSYRVVVLHKDWTAACESHLISHYKPLWNTTITGLGNHAPGKGRHAQKRSLWDTLHEGRLMATNFDVPYSIGYLEILVYAWCQQNHCSPRSFSSDISIFS